MINPVRISALLVALAAATSHADETLAQPDSGPVAVSWFHTVAINGFASAGYTYNFNLPASGLNGLRVFDFAHNQPRLEVVELVIQRPAIDRGEIGFRIDATLGAAIPKVTAASGLFRDAEGQAGVFDLQQAFVSYVAPLGRGLKLDVGKFVTPAGAELIEGYDGYNDNVSRSLLFGYAIPFTHTGVKASYPIAPWLTASAMGVMGWDNFKDNNDAKTLGAQVSLTPSDQLSVFVTYLGGAERNDIDWRHLLDIVAVFKPNHLLCVGLNLDLATDANAIAPGQSAGWGGLAGYVRWTPTGRLALSARAEWFRDAGGARTGTSQDLVSVTLTPEVKITSALIVRGELRLDQSTEQFFETAAGQSAVQATAALNVVFVL